MRVATLTAAVDQLSRTLLRLNLDTREYHAAADQGWASLRHLRVRRRDYIDQLVVTFGFESSIESVLAYTPGLRGLIDLRQRARVGLIAQDLIAFGMTPQQLSQLPQYMPPTPFEDAIEGLGWMYLTERATLHFDAVRRWLLRTLGAATPVTYLRASEGEANLRWNDLGRVLDRVCCSEDTALQLVAAARNAFRAQIRWNEQMRMTPLLRSAI